MSSEHLGLRVGPADIGAVPGERARMQQALCQRGFRGSWEEVAGERISFHCGFAGRVDGVDGCHPGS